MSDDEIIEEAEGKEEANAREDYDRAWEEALSEEEPAQEAGAEGEAEEEPVTEDENQEDAPEAAAQADDDDIAELPRSWKRKEAQVWESLPKEAQAIVKRRESELAALVHQKANELAPIANALKEIEPIATKYRMGKNPVTTEQHLLRCVALYEHIKNTPKTEIIQQLMAAEGLKPEDLQQTPETELQRENRELRERLERVENGLQERDKSATAEAQQQYTSSLTNQYSKWANTKNAFGESKYPQALNARFAQTMGSLAIEKLRTIPGASSWDSAKLFLECYKELDGQIRSGNQLSRSSDQNKTEKLRRAATTSFGKGRLSPTKVQFDNIDDAWAATAEEFGMME